MLKTNIHLPDKQLVISPKQENLNSRGLNLKEIVNWEDLGPTLEITKIL